MVVVDFHVHVAKYHMWNPWVHEFMKTANPKLYENFDHFMTPKNVLRFMEEEGVDLAVILAEITPIATGLVSNEFIVEFCQGSDKLIPFASINPHMDPDPPKTLTKLVRNFGMKGLKLQPPYQHFYPNDATLYPLYEKAEELGIPVVFHTGSSVFRNVKLKFGDPLYLDEIAVDFPSLKIVQAHGGRGFWYEKAFFLAKHHRNVYLEISGLPPSKPFEVLP